MQDASWWPFCPLCGTILDAPVTDDVKCSFCPFQFKFSNISLPEVTTRSPPTTKPAWIGDDKDEDTSNKHAIIQEPCPKCAHPELYFYTMQLRSVDEGSTVFYECPKCTHKYSVNN
jgi:DNA-directed RNA polymerase I subunit RPA12